MFPIKALDYAIRAHSGQYRKNTGNHYIVHPISVASHLMSHGIKDVYILEAALLHDVVEDTPVRIEDIEETFGLRVRDLVAELTKKIYLGTREARVAKCTADFAQTSEIAQIIKFADILDNLRDLSKLDPEVSTMYLKEKRRFFSSAKESVQLSPIGLSLARVLKVSLT